MVRTILLVMAVGCGTNAPGVHDDVACSGYTLGGVEAEPMGGCDRACEMPQQFVGGPKCDIGSGQTPCEYMTVDGVKGCCEAMGEIVNLHMAFVECETQ